MQRKLILLNWNLTYQVITNENINLRETLYKNVEFIGGYQLGLNQVVSKVIIIFVRNCHMQADTKSHFSLYYRINFTNY